MENNENNQEKQLAFIKLLCESRLEGYRKSLNSEFRKANWKALEEISNTLEKDCCSIGAIELCGKLSRLKSHLSEKPQNSGLIFSTVMSIDQCISELIIFLNNYLLEDESSESKFSSKCSSYDNIPEERLSSWTCSIQ